MDQLITRLKLQDIIRSDIVADVMSKVDRADFTDTLPYNNTFIVFMQNDLFY